MEVGEWQRFDRNPYEILKDRSPLKSFASFFFVVLKKLTANLWRIGIGIFFASQRCRTASVHVSTAVPCVGLPGLPATAAVYGAAHHSATWLIFRDRPIGKMVIHWGLVKTLGIFKWVAISSVLIKPKIHCYGGLVRENPSLERPNISGRSIFFHSPVTYQRCQPPFTAPSCVLFCLFTAQVVSQWFAPSRQSLAPRRGGEIVGGELA